MRFFFDTEFYEDGKQIHPISIGIVSEKGDVYYAEFDRAQKWARKSQWLRENVLPHLRGPMKETAEIAEDIIKFVGEEPEFWAYFAAYDWVMMCQIFGTMMELPKGWPMRCNDVAQLYALTPVAIRNQIVRPDNSAVHDALADAIWCKDFFINVAMALKGKK